jgi:hypothetical protein
VEQPLVAFTIRKLVSCEHHNMHRRIARLLLLVTLVGNLAPLALAATAPPHACCVRKAVHHCHDSLAPESGPVVIADAGACDHECCRAITTAQSAFPQPRVAAIFLQVIDVRLAASQPQSPTTATAGFQSTRAPPAS